MCGAWWEGVSWNGPELRRMPGCDYAREHGMASAAPFRHAWCDPTSRKTPSRTSDCYKHVKTALLMGKLPTPKLCERLILHGSRTRRKSQIWVPQTAENKK